MLTDYKNTLSIPFWIITQNLPQDRLCLFVGSSMFPLMKQYEILR